MAKVFVKMHTGYAGSEGYDVVDVNFSEEELSDLNSKAAAATFSGWRIFVSDIGDRGSYWYSNGTRWLLDQPFVVLSKPSAATDELAHDMAVENADMYGLAELEGDEGEEYVTNDAVEGSWEIFNLEEHGAYLSPATLE